MNRYKKKVMNGTSLYPFEIFIFLFSFGIVFTEGEPVQFNFREFSFF